MYPYAFNVSLRIVHPSMDAAELSAAMPFAPATVQQAGTPRRTPNGAVLDGLYRETCWIAVLESECLSVRESLEDCLLRRVRQLQEYAALFERVRAGQGRVELFVGLFADKNCGVELPPSLALSIGQLGLTLRVEIYP